ncbi:MAG: hypothetical protein EA383_01625 [Spirochaetaceae bacterium]|nr:MAG: hypothetical protein EA383_01625 [Spirochaetaceae bacterium]
MKLHLLGSGSAEGWPAPFCDCEACNAARRSGGHNIRTRSNAIIDTDIKIDWSADTLMQLQRDGLSLSGLRSILFTHEHADHIVPTELAWMMPPFTRTPPERPVRVYGNAAVLTLLEQAAGADMPAGIELHKLEAFQVVELDPQTRVTPLPADHTDGALVFRVERAGYTLFYGHDSGIYPDATVKALNTGPVLNLALVDCNNGPLDSTNIGHMDIAGVTQVVARLRAGGAVNDQTRIIATHFSHNCGAPHEQLTGLLGAHGIEVAFDGLVADVV